ncbi:major facilitator superfamily domain-containing protein [Stachybotrys elegans]|uniref:Major facilitator superfamily domain-containing protein n=1 Tax=Stachybotrys elegans TaxID=80388 RepID=A0A8K0SMX1_9HYPO|nr:major facilitator superfamily domain-containing protein [Stachybotrys elegans]
MASRGIETQAISQAHESHDVEKVAIPADDSGIDNSSGTRSPAPESKAENVQKKGLKWILAYSSLIASVLLFSMDNTIVADIQPSIIAAFDDIANLSWVGVGFALGSVCILPVAKAYGIFNIKWIFIGCFILFEVGSALCGAAPNMNAMIVGRVIAGVGGSGMYCGGIVYISVMTNIKERPLFVAGIAMMYNIGSVVGPVVGGAFAESSATWRWAFYINLVLAAVLAPAFIFCLPSINPVELSTMQKLRLQDWVGIVVFCGGSVCFTMALTFGGAVYAFDSGSEITLWVVAGVLLIAFVLVTIYHPFIPYENKLYPSHFTKRIELNILQYQLFSSAGVLLIAVYYTPLLFQFTRGDTPIEAGVRLLPLVILVGVASIVNGGAMPRLGYHMPWYVFGNALALTGSACMYTITTDTPAANIYGYTVLIGIGVGTYLAAGFSVVQAMVEEKDMNNAVGFMSVGTCSSLSGCASHIY